MRERTREKERGRGRGRESERERERARAGERGERERTRERQRDCVCVYVSVCVARPVGVQRLCCCAYRVGHCALFGPRTCVRRQAVVNRCRSIRRRRDGWRGCPGPEERDVAAFGVATACVYIIYICYIVFMCTCCKYG